MEILRHQAPTWVVQMPGLVSPAELEGLQRRVLGTTQERMLRELAEALNVLTAARPLVLVLEDLHWSDYATLDALAALARRREPARLLLLGTYRPPDALQRGHPLHTVQHELHMHGQCAELALPLLSEAAVADYLAVRFPDAQLPAGLARLVHQRTEGNPLFMVQVVEDWVRRGWLVQVDGRWTLQVGLAALAVTVPDGLRQMLEQHLDRLSPMEQQVLEVGSVAGATFSAAAVAAGLEAEVVQVEEWCAGLARRRQWLERMESKLARRDSGRSLPVHARAVPGGGVHPPVGSAAGGGAPANWGTCRGRVWCPGAEHRRGAGDAFCPGTSAAAGGAVFAAGGGDGHGRGRPTARPWGTSIVSTQCPRATTGAARHIRASH